MAIKLKVSVEQIKKESRRIKKTKLQSAFINLKPKLGCFNWAEFLFLIGAAQAGKSYAVIDFFVHQFLEHETPFYWFRLTERQSAQLLNNKAEKLIDPDIRRKYNLDLVTNGTNVYNVKREEYTVKHRDGTVETKTRIIEKKLMARVLALSTFYADKGNGYFDKDYKGWINIGLDEFQPESNEKSSFDITYAFVRQIENIARNRKTKLRVIGCANMLEEASDILCAFDFIPEQYGLFKLKKKRCVIWYIEPTEAYKEMRKGSVADMLLPNSSMYSNEKKQDYSLIYKGRLHKPQYVIKFSKDEKTWFTLWDNGCICNYNNERCPVIAMKPYIDEIFNPKNRDTIFLCFDTRAYVFRNLIAFKQFEKQLSLLKPRK